MAEEGCDLDGNGFRDLGDIPPLEHEAVAAADFSLLLSHPATSLVLVIHSSLLLNWEHTDPRNHTDPRRRECA